MGLIGRLWFSRWVVWIAVAIVVVVVAAGCADRSKLSRGKAEKLIAEALMKKPPAAKVDLWIEVDPYLRRRSEWEAFLAGLKERGYEPSVQGKPPLFLEEMGDRPLPLIIDWSAIMLSLPRDLTALDMGPYKEHLWDLKTPAFPPEARGRLVRYGKRVRVRVTGISMQGDTQAMVEYKYEWEVDEGARKALERLRRDFDEIRAWVRQFSFGDRVKLPHAPIIPELQGESMAVLRLYDDGWRVLPEPEFPPELVP
jgi:hypothetical protein